MRLYLIRHAQTAWNDSGRAQGQTDIPLNERGIEQAKLVAAAMRGHELDSVLSSDLARARDTARHVAEAVNAPHQEWASLRERSFGDWEGEPFTRVASATLETALANSLRPIEVRPPNGESLQDVWNRLADVVEHVKASSDRIVIVVHGAAGSVLLARLIRGSLETSRSFRFANTGITELERRTDGYWSIVRYNDTAHLLDAHAPVAGVTQASRT